MTKPPRYPAIAAWDREFAGGTRTPETFDWLWRAACAEDWAREYEAMGLPTIARSYRARARSIIQKAVGR